MYTYIISHNSHVLATFTNWKDVSCFCRQSLLSGRSVFVERKKLYIPSHFIDDHVSDRKVVVPSISDDELLF